MISSNNKEPKVTAYVCYLDILGFKNDIRNNWGKNLDPLDKILSIKKELMKFNEKREGISLRYTDPARYYPEVITMSDSFIVYYQLIENYRRTFDWMIGLESILHGISNGWLAAIKNGYTIRGAIDIGEVYWNLKENDVIGPAFINAYELESEVVKNSRVIISSAMNKLFDELANYNEEGSITFIKKYFRKDVDGYIIIDPNILHNSDAERIELIEKLKNIRNATSGIKREKYTPLINMLSEKGKIDLKASDFGLY